MVLISSKRSHPVSGDLGPARTPCAPASPPSLYPSPARLLAGRARRRSRAAAGWARRRDAASPLPLPPPRPRPAPARVLSLPPSPPPSFRRADRPSVASPTRVLLPSLLPSLLVRRAAADAFAAATMSDWAEVADPGSGKTYYYSASTGQTSWEKVRPRRSARPRAPARAAARPTARGNRRWISCRFSVSRWLSSRAPPADGHVPRRPRARGADVPPLFPPSLALSSPHSPPALASPLPRLPRRTMEGGRQ